VYKSRLIMANSLTHRTWTPQDGQYHQDNDTNKHQTDYDCDHVPSWCKILYL